jgi:hypothetical protein
MNLRLWFPFILALLIGCQQKDELYFDNLVGEYYNGIDSTSYNYLILRDDSTYLGHQSYLWGDVFIYYYGTWAVKDNILILYKGQDISEKVQVIYAEDLQADTLIVNISVDFLRVFPAVRFWIDSDTADLSLTKNQIKIIKNKYWDLSDLAIAGDNYKYAPVTLNFRSKNIYGTIGYVFTNKEVSISLPNNFTPPTKMDSILCKYMGKNGILFSFDETYEIESNNLKKDVR